MMKKVSIALLFFLFVTGFALIFGEQVTAETTGPSWLKNGTKMVFGVNSKGKTYDFIVTVKQLSPGIGFDWVMTEPVNKKGEIIMSSKAVEDAVKQRNLFQNGRDELTDATSVWVSRKVFSEATKKDGSIVIDSGKGDETLVMKGNKDITVKVDGKDETIRVIYAETDKGNKFWILNDHQNPIIMNMDLGWSINIKEITTGK